MQDFYVTIFGIIAVSSDVGACELFCFSCNLNAYAFRFEHRAPLIRTLRKFFKQEGHRIPPPKSEGARLPMVPQYK